MIYSINKKLPFLLFQSLTIVLLRLIKLSMLLKSKNYKQRHFYLKNQNKVFISSSVNISFIGLTKFLINILMQEIYSFSDEINSLIICFLNFLFLATSSININTKNKK